MRSFKIGLTPILVATDVVARGLDFPQVAHVLSFDLPNDIDDYVHRIGHTGRDLFIAFLHEGNFNIAKSLAELTQESNQEVPSWFSAYASRCGITELNGWEERAGIVEHNSLQRGRVRRSLHNFQRSLLSLRVRRKRRETYAPIVPKGIILKIHACGIK